MTLTATQLIKQRGDVGAIAALLDWNLDAVMKRGWVGKLLLHYTVQGGIECVRLLPARTFRRRLPLLS